MQSSCQFITLYQLYKKRDWYAQSCREFYNNCKIGEIYSFISFLENVFQLFQKSKKAYNKKSTLNKVLF